MTLPFRCGEPPDPSASGDGDVPHRTPRSHASGRSDAPDRVDDSLSQGYGRDPDRVLIDRIRTGDERALEMLVRTYAPALTRFAYEYVGSADTAEDLVDDLFVWVWEHRADWSVQGTVRGYLFGAIRNRALNARRNSAYRAAWTTRHTADPAAAGVSGAPPDAEAVVETQELGVLLRAAIDRLAEGRRTAVLLRWMHGMSYAEIAEVTGTSVVGVKQQLNRALRDLRADLPDFVR